MGVVEVSEVNCDTCAVDPCGLRGNVKIFLSCTGWKPKQADSDTINNPPHYTAGAVECIDAIRASMTADEFRGHLKACCIKYLWRYRDKGGAESLKKCRWYLDRLIKEVESQ